MIWTLRKGTSPEVLGLIPEFLSLSDLRPARVQLHENYAHGGGWRPFTGFKLERNTRLRAGDHTAVEDPLSFTLEYPEDPPMRALAYATLRTETVVLFQYSWVVVLGAWGWEVARMD